MAAVRPLAFIFILLGLLVLASLSPFAGASGYYRAQLHPSECRARCAYRCSATHHRKPCMFFCQKCCSTCRCVPPGTYGNRQYCACYDNWKTQEGGHKCP